MPSWPSAEARVCSGRLLLQASRGRRRALFLSAVLATAVFAQQKPVLKNDAAHRSNELTLAGMRPGQDTLKKAQVKFGTKDMATADDGVLWKCANSTLRLDLDPNKTIRGVILSAEHLRKVTTDAQNSNKIEEMPLPCYLKLASTPLELEQGKGLNFRNLWVTGKGTKLGDSTKALARTYGPPDSKSPSTRDGQPLELWYYAFDWAGPDVPQVMEVLCTREQDGKPGRVIEITLAAPSL
jgi:hypothetical protein